MQSSLFDLTGRVAVRAPLHLARGLLRSGNDSRRAAGGKTRGRLLRPETAYPKPDGRQSAPGPAVAHGDERPQARLTGTAS
jgi:hypothetical protein